MDINWTILISVLVCCITLVSIILSTIRPYLNRKNEIRSLELTLAKNRLFAEIDLEAVSKKLDDFYMNYIDTYIVYKFVAKKIIYIKSDEVDEMIKSLTKKIAIEMSETYIFYMQLINAINTEEDMIQAIFNRVQELTVDRVATYNKEIDGE